MHPEILKDQTLMYQYSYSSYMVSNFVMRCAVFVYKRMIRYKSKYVVTALTIE